MAHVHCGLFSFLFAITIQPLCYFLQYPPGKVWERPCTKLCHCRWWCLKELAAGCSHQQLTQTVPWPRSCQERWLAISLAGIAEMNWVAMERAIWKWRLKHCTNICVSGSYLVQRRLTWKRKKCRESINMNGIVWIILWDCFSSIWSIHVFAAFIWQNKKVISAHNLSCSSRGACQHTLMICLDMHLRGVGQEWQ